MTLCAIPPAKIHPSLLLPEQDGFVIATEDQMRDSKGWVNFYGTCTPEAAIAAVAAHPDQWELRA